MTRTELLLAILAAAEGQAFTPVQIQKAAFLVTRNLPNVVDQGPGFAFAPYDYGPFDRSVYVEAEALERIGLASVSQMSSRWRTYSATQLGVDQGKPVELITKLTAHLRHEETDGLSLIDASLTEAQWRHFASVHAGRIGPDAPMYMPWLLSEASPQTLDAVLDKFPPQLLTAFREQWAPEYAARNVWKGL